MRLLIPGRLVPWFSRRTKWKWSGRRRKAERVTGDAPSLESLRLLMTVWGVKRLTQESGVASGKRR